MKKTTLLLITSLITVLLQAQVSKTINISTGELAKVLTANEKNSVTNLTISGTIDARDFLTMRDDMPVLGMIDLSGAVVDEYNGSEGTSSYTNYYPANTVPQYAFCSSDMKEGKESLETVILPPTVKTIEQWAFAFCTGLTNVSSMLSSVNIINAYAFWGCSGLTILNIPPSVTSIGNLAFGICTGLTSITIPASVSFLDLGAFGSYSCILTVDPENQTYSSIDGILFDKSQKTLIQCSGSITGTYSIPTTVSEIADFAFSYCSLLNSVIIPESVISIGQSSFALSGLTGTLTLPQSLTKIDVGAFQNCSGITGSLIIPSSVKSIGFQAFEYCSGINTVAIPSSVFNIGDYAFSSCRGLKSIITNQTKPLNLSSTPNVFRDVDKANCVLHVPIGTKTLYSLSAGWKDFRNIVEEEIHLENEALKQENSKITFYPNPFEDELQLVGLEGKAKLEIFDRCGKQVFLKDVVNCENIPVISLPKGIYYAKISSESGAKVQKLVKK